MSGIPESLTSKILHRSELATRAWGWPLAFTRGVFDALHRGHTLYLSAARELDATLLVGVNSNASVRHLAKEPDRPLNREEDRLLVPAGLASVSYVALFHEKTPCELTEQCRPDVCVKAAITTSKCSPRPHSYAAGVGVPSLFRSSLGIQLQRSWSGFETGADWQCRSRWSTYRAMSRSQECRK